MFSRILGALLLSGALAVAATYLFKFYSGPRFVRYPGFGIDIPVSYSIHGIDVSRYQHDIDWKEVKMMQEKQVKIGFAFMKATEGEDRIDERFSSNWRNAGRQGIPRGAYHFFIASKSGRSQAQHFINAVDLKKGDMPPVLDIETVNGTSAADIRQRAKEWLQIVEKHYKVKPLIYTNVSFYRNILGKDFDAYPLWIAHYLVKDKPRVEREWAFWQHNETGRVNGIDALVDFNVFNGDSAALRRMLLK